MAGRATAGASGRRGRRLWWIAAGLSLGPAVSNGIARFAYGLVLPAMREDLGWSYAEAGWLNTANAIGYLAGALLSLALIGRLGARRLFVWGMALTVGSLALSALTRDIWWLGLWRVLAGVGGAPVFVAGGVLASGLFAGEGRRSALAVALYFGGGGIGMLLSGLALPPFLAWFGPAGWPLAWLMLAGAAWLAFVPSWLAVEAAPQTRQGSEPKGGARAGRLPVLRMLPALAGYLFFGLGYLVYMTFFVAWMGVAGAGAALVAAAWAVMGAAVMVSPLLWRRVLAASRGGGALSLTLAATGTGAVLPVAAPTEAMFIASAALFGASFFMVPAAVTDFSRVNLPERQLGAAIALFTVVFSVGQIVGPVAAGALSDSTGGTGAGLAAGAAILLGGALLALMQRPLPHPPRPF
jgi:predicted MFS family arabinose efflux permease